MDQVDFLKYPKFPLSSETLVFMQDMALLAAKAAGIGGDNYILSGCATTGGNVSDGIVVIGGEPMPFVGGTQTAYVIVKETSRTVTADGQVYADIYTTRKARFGTGSGQVAWALFGRISIPAIIESIASVIPAGLISMWSGTVAPTGWHLCDGTDGTPDLRGRFVVGQDLADVDFVTMGQTGGAKDVALTVAQMPAHTHSYNDRILDANPSGTTGYAKPGSVLAATTGSTGNGDTPENLPPYYVLAYIMKT